MRYLYWAHMKVARLSVVLIAALAYIFLLLTANSYFFAHIRANSTEALFLSWLSFGFSTLVGLLFLTVTALVWLYARDRPVALLLFCFSCTLITAFATLKAEPDSLFATVNIISSMLAVSLLFALLLRFPKNYFASSHQATNTSDANKTRNHASLWCYYITALILLCVLISAAFFGFSLLSYIRPQWRSDPQLASLYQFTVSLQNIYYLIGLSSVLGFLGLSYHRASVRERQQLRIFVGGVILSITPLLLLTILPNVLRLPAADVVDGQISALALAVFPLALGYSVLRYQILVFDTYIRRAATLVVGIIALALLVYLTVTVSSLFLGGTISSYVIEVAVSTAILASMVWSVARTLTDQLFFREMSHYRRMIEKPVIDELLDLDDASRLLTSAAIHTFETPQVCLFVLDESCGYYRPLPPIIDKANDQQRSDLMRTLLQEVNPSVEKEGDWLVGEWPAMQRLASAPRALLLGEAKHSAEEVQGIGRYLTTTTSLGDLSMLLAPVRSQGKMIGLLVLGDRGDQMQYAGPDFEAVQLLLGRFSPVLETARLYARANQHSNLLNNLYLASMQPESAFQSVEEIAAAYVNAAASATEAHAEVWLADKHQTVFFQVASNGNGPVVAHHDFQVDQEHDWFPILFEGNPKASEWEYIPPPHMPACFSEPPDFPFAWLPLIQGERKLGALLLTYPLPHFFMKEEMGVLELFASQYATSLENARFTLQLQEAYEGLKEVDRLKDQFIMTASHELRTPLTAVQGYIELLSEYNTTLSEEARAEFIEKAHRGCEELTLLLGNIMDASRVHIDAINVRLRSISLYAAVAQVLEILDSLIRREQRLIQHDIPRDLRVLADDLRLRQILLNLMSNAMKYSPAGTSIELSVSEDESEVTLHIRDHGSGVPPEDQQRLFERFVRLDRDMNSPVRGAGLGLYICKQLVEAMGGRIWIESSGEVGRGSTFAFTLQRIIRDPQPELLRIQGSDAATP